ncbi:protein S100-G-like [Huso huso]|uniref:Protein S100-G-like n=2 Tax=Acipenseridae TaxID=7900 RepID=A0ABR0Y3N9_HUSHU
MLETHHRDPALCQTVAESRSAIMSGLQPLEKSLLEIIALFNRYAKKEGHTKTLSKREASELISKELPNFMGKCDPKNVPDLDGDGEMTFEEFTVMILTVANAFNEMINSY